MKTWGFSKDDIWRAVRAASYRLGPETQLTLRDVGERGKAIKFILRFESSTRRLLKRERIKLDPSNEAEYPPGVMVRPGGKWVTMKQPDAIPASELFSDGHLYRREYRHFRRGCGAPCWHAFGHFLRCLFEINPEGRVKTGLMDYRGASGFEDTYPATDGNIGSQMEPLMYSEACDCYHYGVEHF
jgi:hypothetical protein